MQYCQVIGRNHCQVQSRFHYLPHGEFLGTPKHCIDDHPMRGVEVLHPAKNALRSTTTPVIMHMTRLKCFATRNCACRLPLGWEENTAPAFTIQRRNRRGRASTSPSESRNGLPTLAPENATTQRLRREGLGGGIVAPGGLRTPRPPKSIVTSRLVRGDAEAVCPKQWQTGLRF